MKKIIIASLAICSMAMAQDEPFYNLFPRTERCQSDRQVQYIPGYYERQRMEQAAQEAIEEKVIEILEERGIRE
jgi:hypothetical protein